MELATPPPAARAPVAWFGWWLMPLALGAGTVVTAVAGPEEVQIPATFAGAAVTVAGTVCVRLLIRTRSQLRRAGEQHRSAQAEHSQQLYADVRGREQRFASERSALEARLGEQAAHFEARFAEHAQAYEAEVAERTQAYEAAIAARADDTEERLALQQAVVARLGENHLPKRSSGSGTASPSTTSWRRSARRPTRARNCAPRCARSCGPRCSVSRRS